MDESATFRPLDIQLGFLTRQTSTITMDPVLQYWLLNLATDFPVPLRLLPPVLDDPGGRATALNVRSLRGFSVEYGVKRLVELADANLMKFTQAHEGAESRTVASPEVLTLVRRGDTQGLSFELTTAGGEAWERTAEPRWHEMDGGFAEQGHRDGELVTWSWTFFSQDCDRLMAIIGWFPFIEDHEVDLDTVTLSLHDEFQVRYWKRLPNVHVAIFQTREQPGSVLRNRGIAHAPWFERWSRARFGWYRKPWHLEGWPPSPKSD